jgi:hypothetical protein
VADAEAADRDGGIGLVSGRLLPARARHPGDLPGGRSRRRHRLLDLGRRAGPHRVAVQRNDACGGAASFRPRSARQPTRNRRVHADVTAPPTTA